MPHPPKLIRPRIGRSLLVIALLSTMLMLVSAAPALAFSTGPHTEIVEDAGTAEGFGEDAIKLMEINNSFMDLYQPVGAFANPYCDCASSPAHYLTLNVDTEHWPMSVIEAAARGHFDTYPGGLSEGMSRAGLMESLGTTSGIGNEWDRLQRSLWTLLQEARVEDNPQKALAVLGEASHEIQDFYAHTNWVESQSGHGLAGSDGPGLQEHGFGSSPTWFDLSADQRGKLSIYGDSTPGHSRGHGYWSTDNNENVLHGMNKDSPPRPYYLQAAVTAYFATRQVFEAARSWLKDDAFWHEMQNYQVTGKKARELNEDQQGLFELTLFSGRWDGYGGVYGGPDGEGAAGNLLELRHAAVRYFGDVGKTVFRAEFERNIVRLANPSPTGRVDPVPSSQDLQRRMEVVVTRVTRMASVGAFGLGDVYPDQADMFTEVGIDGQTYRSDVIHGENQFSFANPYEPFTNFRVIPKRTIEQEPVESIEVEVKTACAFGSGTDDDVVLQLGKDLSWPLNKRETNDFERCDDDTYSIPIDGAIRRGLRVGDIDRVWIKKSEDGFLGGAWKLGGVQLTVNGRRIYANTDINRWMQDGQRLWWANNFVRRNPRGPKIPIWLQLWDDDFDGGGFLDYNPFDPISGGDDPGDVNPFDRRDVLSFGYVPGRKVERSSTGGNQLGGRLGFGGDRASVTLTVETLIPQLIDGSASMFAGEAEGVPDLIITALDERSVTVKNVGTGPAGAFRLRAETGATEDTAIFEGLPAGASDTQPLHLLTCEFVEAEVDDLGQIKESDESNNKADTQGSSKVC